MKNVLDELNIRLETSNCQWPGKQININYMNNREHRLKNK